MEVICPICEGTGLKMVERPDGSRAARDVRLPGAAAECAADGAHAHPQAL